MDELDYIFIAVLAAFIIGFDVHNTKKVVKAIEDATSSHTLQIQEPVVQQETIRNPPWGKFPDHPR